MDLLTWMKGSTPEQCLELGLLILELGTKKRTPQWFVNIDAAIEEQNLNFEIREPAA